MNLIEHAKNEFKLLNWPGNDEMQKVMCENILEVLEVISKQGHSGFSIQYLMNHVNRLVNYKPISPLTGKDDEWNDVGEGLLQNKRCGAVFKNTDTNNAYYLDGIVFIAPDGCGFTSKQSHINIEFPFNPPEKPEYIYFDTDGHIIHRENTWWKDKYGHLNQDKLSSEWIVGE